MPSKKKRKKKKERKKERKKISLVLNSTFRPTFPESTLYIATRILKLGTRICDLLFKILKVDTSIFYEYILRPSSDGKKFCFNLYPLLSVSESILQSFFVVPCSVHPQHTHPRPPQATTTD